MKQANSINSDQQRRLCIQPTEELYLKYTHSRTYVCSPMNYIGGKYRLLTQLLPLFPKQINTFVDLFCGGCNVGINSSANSIVFNDNLSYLIDLYNTFNNHSTDSIVSHIEGRIAEYQLSLTNEKGYLSLRHLYNIQRNPLDLFVLTAYSFNHQIRFNQSHEYNNPFGKERSCYNERMKSNLISFLHRLHTGNMSFCCNNFDLYDFSSLGKDDFIYCDPPYLISTGTYNDGKRGFTGWGINEEQKLLSLLTQLDRKGIRFALSNVLVHKGRTNDILTKWIADNDYYVTHLNMDYTNSNYHSNKINRTETDEVVVCNYLPGKQQLSLDFA